EQLLESGDDLLLAGIDDVVGLEARVDVDAERSEALALGRGDVGSAVRQVADVADARLDGVVAAQVSGDGPSLCRGLDDDEALGHSARHLSAGLVRHRLPEQVVLVVTCSRSSVRAILRLVATPDARPLLVVDGDSFTHRAYHALPKTMRREDGGPA